MTHSKKLPGSRYEKCPLSLCLSTGRAGLWPPGERPGIESISCPQGFQLSHSASRQLLPISLPKCPLSLSRLFAGGSTHSFEKHERREYIDHFMTPHTPLFQIHIRIVVNQLELVRRHWEEYDLPVLIFVLSADTFLVCHVCSRFVRTEYV